MIFYCIITAFLNTVTSVAIGGAVLFRRRSDGPNLPLFLFLVSGAAWSSSYCAWLLSNSASSALLWTRILSAAAILVPATYYHFVVRLLNRGRLLYVVISYALGIGFAILSLLDTPLIVRTIAPFEAFPFWPRAGSLYPVYLLYFASFPVIGWFMLLSRMRGANPVRRNQLKYILVSTTLGFIGGATNFPYWFEVRVPPVGNGLIIPYLVGVAYAVIGLRLVAVNYAVIKLSAYILGAIPLAVTFTAAFVLLDLTAGGVEHSAVPWVVASLLLSYCSFLVLPLLKTRLDRLLDRTLLRTFTSGRERLRELAYEVAGLRDEADIFRRTAETVSSALEAGAAVYIRSDMSSRYLLRAAAGLSPRDPAPEELPGEDPFVAQVEKRQRAVLVEEVAAEAARVLPHLPADRWIEVAVPIHADTYFFGALLLGGRRQYRLYADTDLALLDSLCLQIGLHLRARQLERRANQAEKLISLGTLAAGLAHELRNPLVSIKTFAVLLEEQKFGASTEHEFAATVLRDVGRIESIVENVAAFATDRKVAFSWIRLEEVVRAAYDISRSAFMNAGVAFAFEPEDVPVVHGNHNQLTQVVLNLLNNAVQAFDGAAQGKVTVGLRRTGDGTVKPSVQLTISDNGPGVQPEVLERLFEPFTTTKATGNRDRNAGMGLGLAIVKRIIDGHRGTIQVDSKPGQGTTFTLLFPHEVAEE